MCTINKCNNKVFSGGLCLRHYRYNKYGTCSLEGCHSPACATHGMCDNCKRRGAPKSRHYGKFINTEDEKWCEGCKSLLPRKDFYMDRGHSAYLCKECSWSQRVYVAKRRREAWQHGMERVAQTSANLCVKCWSPLGEWEADHIVPRSLGGSDDVSNLQIMCIRCNRTKSNKESVDYRIFER